MTHSFEKDYWERHWDKADDSSGTEGRASEPNPYLVAETSDLQPGTALDAGCGAGAEAIWLAGHGWQVTAADISASALALASGRAEAASVSDRVTWIEADLTTWEPAGRFDLVTTNYAHPTIPQLDFYERIAKWVAPGGTLLIVGHLHVPGSVEADHHPPEKATATPETITRLLDGGEWSIDTAEERTRDTGQRGGGTLNDVIVRATRRP